MTDEPPVFNGLIAENFEPGPFEPIETWEQHLAKVQAMPDSPFKEYAIYNAKRMIELIRQGLRAQRHGVPWLQ